MAGVWPASAGQLSSRPLGSTGPVSQEVFMAGDTLFHALFWGLLGCLMLVRVLSVVQVRRAGANSLPTNRPSSEKAG